MNLHGCTVRAIESVVGLYESQKDVYAIQDKLGDDLYIDVIIDILKKYKYLKSKGLYHAPADVKNFKGSEDELPVVVPSEFEIPCGRAQGPTEILIQLYEEGKKVGYIQKEIYERYYQVIKLGDAYKKCGMWDEIERYWNDKEIKKYIRIYRYLKEQGLYHAPADVDIFDACADIDNLPSALLDKETPIEKGAAKETSTKERPINKLLIEKKVERRELHEAKQMMPRPVKPYEDIVADPSKSFEIMKKAVAVIAKRVGKALLITGNGGIGKTYAVQEVLESYGYREYEDYEVIKTKSTAFSLYQLMYENRDKICIFDDCDSILRDVEGRSVLKSALDSTSRDVSWNSQRNNIVNTRNCRNNDEVEETLKQLQQFDPPGIGARSLQECLLLQIDRLQNELKASEEHSSGHDTIGRKELLELMRKVIKHHFDEFKKKHWNKIQNAMGLSDIQVETLQNEIRRLNPKPGASLGEAEGRNIQQITPDFIVDTADDGSVSFYLNSGNVPELKVSPSFTEMVNTYKNNREGMSRQAKEALLYAKEKVEKAQGFIEAVKQRRHTLYITMKAIIDWQRRYFQDGDEADLKPMILKDIA